MGFGLSFGSSGSKTNSTTTGSSNTVGSQIGSSQTNSTQTQGSNTTNAGSSSSSGSNVTSQTGAINTTGTSAQTQTQTSSLLDSGTLGNLSGLVNHLLGSSGSSAASKASGAGLNYIGEFDPNQFVAQTLAAARSNSDINVKQAIGGIMDAIGGKNNSATALLGQQVQNQANASLAGIAGQAASTAQGIVQSGVQVATQAGSAANAFLENLVATLKGSAVSATGATDTTTGGSQVSSQSGTTNTSENNQNQSTSATDSVTQLTQLLSQILNTTSNTDATQHTVGSDSKSGGGLTFS